MQLPGRASSNLHVGMPNTGTSTIHFMTYHGFANPCFRFDGRRTGDHCRGDENPQGIVVTHPHRDSCGGVRVSFRWIRHGD